MQLFDALGLNWKILVAQLINFALLLWILYKFGYKPILKFVDERTKKIEKGVKDAAAAEKTLEGATLEHKKIVSEAHKEAQDILTKASSQATEHAHKIMQEGKVEAEAIMAKAQRELETQKGQIIRDAREEVAELVVSATEKLLEEKMDDKADRDFIEKIIKKQ